MATAAPGSTVDNIKDLVLGQTSFNENLRPQIVYGCSSSISVAITTAKFDYDIVSVTNQATSVPTLLIA